MEPRDVVIGGYVLLGSGPGAAGFGRGASHTQDTDRLPAVVPHGGAEGSLVAASDDSGALAACAFFADV